MTTDDQHPENLSGTRRLIWLYCIVWLVEGAVRKWVVPSLSLQLLLVRDPIVLLIYMSAIRARVFPSNGWMTCFWVIAAAVSIQGFFHLFQTGASPVVVAFGVRTFVLHIPLIWVVAAVFGRKEIVTMGKWVLYIAPFLAVLMVIQFEVGPDHWLNVASLKGGTQIGSVFGRIRPPAIFSFISGPIHYFILCTAFMMAGFLNRELYPRWLVIVGMLSILLAMSVGASRSLVAGCAVVASCGALAALRTGKNVGAVLGFGLALIIAIAVLSRFDVLKAGSAAFTERWTSEDTGGSGGQVLVDRYGKSFTSSIDWAGRVPLFGLGVGISSNLSAERNKINDTPVEGEWERVIYEIGPITGFLYLFFRAALSFNLIARGLQSLRTNNSICILLGAACALDILSGNVRQVTSYGYTCVCCGLCLAAFRAFGNNSETGEPGEAVASEPVLMERPRMRGRGPLAVGGNTAPS